MKFMNLPKKYCDKIKSKGIIVPLIYDGKVTVGNGASKGPNEIIKASYELEYFDVETNTEPYINGIYTHPKIKPIKKLNFNLSSQYILDKLSPLIDYKKFVVILGSDHSTTISTVNAFEQKYNDFGVIIFDAHSDLREPWGEETWWHACVSNILSKKHKLLISGVRSQDYYEKSFLKSKQGKNIFISYAYELKKSFTGFDLNLKKLPKRVFISFDVDFFDPSVITNTNTPEPGGFDWYEANSLLEKIFKRKEVIGVDITEFSPKGNKENYFSESYTLAKLVYKIFSYKFK
jgi:agmatinase